MSLPGRAAALLDLWFGPVGDPVRERSRPLWFEPDAGFDTLLRRRFLGDHEAAASGALCSWQSDTESALALVLLLDQVPRNIFRGTSRAYATDAAARDAAGRALDDGFAALLSPVWRRFLYLPFEHSEAIADQRRSLALFASLPHDPERPDSMRFARRHHEIIERFGRFPHRNAILGRPSTATELAFLTEPHSSF